MGKYFKEEIESKILLSSYIKMLESKPSSLLFKRDIEEAKYLIEYLGDVKMPISIIRSLSSCFHSFGGRYDVRYDIETIKGLYEIYLTHPDLTEKAMDMLEPVYIKDLFDKYLLPETLIKFIEKYGKTDEGFDKYCYYIEDKAKQLQKKYDNDAKRLTTDYSLKDAYSKGFVEYLEFLIKRKHFDIDKIIRCLPSPKIISEDENLLSEITKKSHDYFGACYPVSYSMLSYLIKYENLDAYNEELSYYVSVSDKKYSATFTKSEFLESIKKEQEIKRLTRKK